MSMANFAYLNVIEDPHIVTNYWKRLLREMKNPLIPFDKYESFGALGTIPAESRIVETKRLVKQLDLLR